MRFSPDRIYCSGSHGSPMFSLRVFPRTAGILLYWLSVVHAFCHEPPLDAPRRLLILRLFKGRGEIRFPFTPPCSKRHWTATFIPISGSPLSALHLGPYYPFFDHVNISNFRVIFSFLFFFCNISVHQSVLTLKLLDNY